MRKLSGSMPAGAPRVSRAANRHVGRAAGAGASAGMVVVLSILFWLIFYQNLPGSLDGFAYKGPANSANIGDRLIKLCMIAISLYVIASRWSLARSVGKYINPGAAALLLLAPLSAAWSIDPSATLLRCVTLASIVLTCYAISLAGWTRQRFHQLALTPLMLILLASLVAGVLYPDRIAEIGTDISQKNAWHGITHGKNEFGMVASMAAIICVNRWLAREGRRLWAAAGALVAFTCLLLSKSNTSLFAALLGIGSMTLLMRIPRVRQRHSTLVTVAITVIILLYELVIQNVLPGVNTLLAPIMSLTGKDTTFSARTIIWQVIKEHIRGAPYLGTGYGAYWTGPSPTSPSYVFVPLMYFYPTEAHNGYLDMINDLGFLGLICLLLFVVWFVRQALQLMQRDRSQAALYLALLFQEMVINLSESDWFSRSTTFAVLLLAATCLSRGLFEQRRHAQSR